jgi:hypothetical protein
LNKTNNSSKIAVAVNSILIDWNNFVFTFNYNKSLAFALKFYTSVTILLPDYYVYI